MFEIELTEKLLILHMRGIYRFLAFPRQVVCALAHVREVSPTVTPELLALPLRATRKAGTRLPGRVIIGSFGTRAGSNFYAIRTGEQAITITLDDEPYGALIMDVDDPAGRVTAIDTAVARAKATGGIGS